MGHPSLENKTPFRFEPLFLLDQEGRPLVVPVLKATYKISGAAGLALADVQAPLCQTGEYWGDPETSSVKYDPEVAFTKVATDIVLIGHAYPASPGAAETTVEVQVGPVRKTIRVLGDRVWVKALGSVTMTRPRPFEKIPLVYEKAFGGFDPDDHAAFESRNPVGVGYHKKNSRVQEGSPLPNLEDPSAPIRSWQDAPPPAATGFVGPHWPPRADFAGSYDEPWQKDRMPLLPADFDMRFFNAASPGLVASGFLKGDEPVQLKGASPGGVLSFRLPGVAAPEVLVELRDSEDRTLSSNLDTIVINLDESVVFLIWRGHMALRNGPQDVQSIKVWVDRPSGHGPRS